MDLVVISCISGNNKKSAASVEVEKGRNFILFYYCYYYIFKKEIIILTRIYKGHRHRNASTNCGIQFNNFIIALLSIFVFLFLVLLLYYILYYYLLLLFVLPINFRFLNFKTLGSLQLEICFMIFKIRIRFLID